MKRCHVCQGRFGLIRHHYNRLQFCSRLCVAGYRTKLEQMIGEIRRFGCMPSGQLQPANRARGR
jgi:hypothetical protein